MVALGVVRASIPGSGEPPIRLVPVPPGLGHVIAEERHSQRILLERLAEGRDDERRGVLEPVEHAPERRGDIRGCGTPVGRGMPGHAEQVVALIGGQTQRAGEGGEHLRARLRTAPLLEPRVVIGRHRGQLRDLLATQPRGAPPRAGT